MVFVIFFYISNVTRVLHDVTLEVTIRGQNLAVLGVVDFLSDLGHQGTRETRLLSIAIIDLCVTLRAVREPMNAEKSIQGRYISCMFGSPLCNQLL